MFLHIEVTSMKAQRSIEISVSCMNYKVCWYSVVRTKVLHASKVINLCQALLPQWDPAWPLDGQTNWV